MKPTEEQMVRDAQKLKELREQQDTPIRRDAVRLLARDMYIQFQAYVEAGFTESQALELLRAWKASI